MANDFDYEADAEVRAAVAEWWDKDFAEGVDQYSQMLAALVGLRAFADWTPSERLATYSVNPPVDPLTGLPPPDRPGIFPHWTMLAAQDQDYYVRMYKDWQGMING